MHRVVRAHLNGFQSKYSVSDDETKQFEAFVNYAVFRSICAENVDPKDLVYDGDDPGIDGVMIFIDDAYVASVEEVEDAFKGRKRDSEVLIVFTQSKTSESWAKSEINTFQSAIGDFLSDTPSYPHSDYMTARREIFDAVLKNVGKIRDGKPSAQCHFVTTGRASEDREIIAARKPFARRLLTRATLRTPKRPSQTGTASSNSGRQRKARLRLRFQCWGWPHSSKFQALPRVMS